MKAAIILFPGSNRERDAVRAVESVARGTTQIVWHTETELPAVDLIVLPGGFSYGDYLRPGAIAARSPVMREVANRAEAGVPVLGICNGFQILTESGLLPGSLMRNGNLRFSCRNVGLRVEQTDTPFTRTYAAGQSVRFPIAHHDGAYFADPETLDRLEGEGRVVFRYAPDENPNGAERDIAGIVNARRNVLGLMPHPENMIDPAAGGIDGRAIFESVAEEGLVLGA